LVFAFCHKSMSGFKSDVIINDEILLKINDLSQLSAKMVKNRLLVMMLEVIKSRTDTRTDYTFDARGAKDLLIAIAGQSTHAHAHITRQCIPLGRNLSRSSFRRKRDASIVKFKA